MLQVTQNVVSKKIKMKCWISSKNDNTGEHLVKASDLRSHFGKFTKEKGTYLFLQKLTQLNKSVPFFKEHSRSIHSLKLHILKRRD